MNAHILEGKKEERTTGYKALKMAVTESESGTGYDDLLQVITKYVFRYEITSPAAWQRARIALLDALGCALETIQESAEARAILGPIIPGTVIPHGFRLPGTSHVLDPVKGAFDLGTLIRYLDHNDAFPGAEWGHPSGRFIDDEANKPRRITSANFNAR